MAKPKNANARDRSRAADEQDTGALVRRRRRGGTGPLAAQVEDARALLEERRATNEQQAALRQKATKNKGFKQLALSSSEIVSVEQLPGVKDLPRLLAHIDDPYEIVRLQELDGRSGADAKYEARLDDLAAETPGTAAAHGDED